MRQASAILHRLAVAVVLIISGGLVTFPVNAGVVSLPVPIVTLYPGDALTEDVVAERRFKSRKSRRIPVALTVDEVIGKVAKRTLLKGKPIALHALRQRHVVKKGQTVRVVYLVGGISITALAMSLRSGGTGDLIQARNVDSGKIITGMIAQDGSLILRVP